ncbi:MAG: methyl-accepting chemotaxis sensory [Geobacteraceae bacterium]|nr:MAG: methyl-accepting chemotaxis sensory [Geobacteraceae bacterium]
MANTAKHIINNEIREDSNAYRTCSLWVERLARLSAELRTIAGSTETEFLGIGAGLHDFYQRAGEISRMSSDVVSRFAGDEVNGAINGLKEILDHMCDYLNHAEHETAQSTGTLGRMNELLSKVTEPLAGFRKLNKVLRMLGTSTKIESARLGQRAAGFDTLAEDVAHLAVQVNEKSGTILEQKEELSAVIRQTLSRILAMEDEQRDHVRMILDKTRQSLATLCDINSRCSAVAADISDASAEVSQNISEVVTSMQFHDIVRQQIEHVQETLDELCGKLNEMSVHKEELKSDISDRIGETGYVCELQAAQLRHACDELMSAVESIIGNLQGIASKEVHMSDETHGMAGVADEAGSSFFTEMESDLSLVTSVLGESLETNRKMSSAMNTVAGTVGEIVRFVGDIENIGEEIELIALNAQIKAARTGTDGAALGVLAEAIQRLSLDTLLHTSGISETLTGITEITESLYAGVEKEAAVLESEVLGMANELGDLLRPLRKVNEALGALLIRMDESVRDLSADIGRTTSGITVHRKVVQVLDSVVDALNEIVAEAHALVPVAPGSDAAEKLKAVAARYTMHSERNIHALVTEIKSGKAAPAATQGKVSGPLILPEKAADELGDNFELF